MKRLALLAALVLASPAHADVARAWSAAQLHVPATAAVVVGIDVGALARSPVFSAALAFVLASQPGVKAGLELVQSKCKLDPATAISGVVAVADAQQREGVLFLQLAVDQRTANACIDTLARTVLNGSDEARIATKRDGVFSELSLDLSQPEPLARSSRDKPRERERVHVAWVDRTVLAIPLDVDDKAKFRRWLNQRGAFKTSRLGKSLARLDKRASIFAASSVAAHFDTPFAVEVGAGAITLGKTNLLADLRLALASPEAATAAVNRTNVALKDLIARGKLTANVVTILKSVLISERGRDLALEVSVPEANLLELLIALAR